MSVIEENVTITSWVGRTSYKNSLTVVILSLNNVIIENIAEALTNIHAVGDYKWKLVVLCSLSLEEIAKQSVLTGKLSIDFVIIAMDTSRMFCIDWARAALRSVHHDLRIRRVVLVNANGSVINTTAVDTSEIITFCSKNRLEMMTADVSKLDDAHFLARKLLKYIEVSIGVQTGIPNLNI